MSHPRLRRADCAAVQVRSAGAGSTRISSPSGPREVAGTRDAVTAAADPDEGCDSAPEPGESGGVPEADGDASAVREDSSPTSTRSSEGSRAPPWRSIVTPKMSGDHVARGGATRSVPAPWASTDSNPADTRFPRLMLPSHSWYVRPAGGCGRPETTSTPPPKGSHMSCPRAPVTAPTGMSEITRAPAVG